MTVFQAVILGIIQGLTEFFPISSSGHLVILQGLFGMKEPQLAFDIFLHLGTVLSILIFLRKDILKLFSKDKSLLFSIILASIPTFLIGFFFKDVVEKFFGMPKVVACMLLVTGAYLIITALYSISKNINTETKKFPGVADSIMVGFSQGIAVMPGISRSGATIGMGILRGLDKELSFKFSFLLAIPAVAGASVLKLHKIGHAMAGKDFVYFIAGALSAMVAGLFAMKVLLKLIKNDKLYLFGGYCILVGMVSLILFR